MTERIYHGGRLAGPRQASEGLWATDDPTVARQYAHSTARDADDYTASVYEIPVAGRVVSLRDAVGTELAEQVEQGDPAALAYAGIADDLAADGIWAVLVETGDEHPTTGQTHRSWWICGDASPVRVETVEA